MLHFEIVELPGIIVPSVTTIEALRDAGDYDPSQSDYVKRWFNRDRFKITVQGPRNLFLAHFDKEVPSEQAEKAVSRENYRGALVEDLLCVGAHSEHRRLQLQFPIVALGSFTISRKHPFVPILDSHDDKRTIDLVRNDDDHEWYIEYRFLVVGKD